ncbi:threonylcarbamoyl-AMP synthase [Candidatus Kaiserbacteria bacterium]|nr:threonylcarbamoyl-AMP synthase [Candidatus Kaiserbacteria bacterium]
MEVIKFSKENTELANNRAYEVLWAAGVVLCPTDTQYALLAWAVEDDAVEKIYSIKGRDEKKPLHALVSCVEMAELYSEENVLARKLLGRSPKGKLTVVVTKRPQFSTGILKNINTFAYRIPDDGFLTSLIDEFSMPVTATSANRSGAQPERSVEKILAQLGDSARDIGLVIDAGELPERQPSTVVDLSGVQPVILREGAISAADVWNAIRPEA